MAIIETIRAMKCKSVFLSGFVAVLAFFATAAGLERMKLSVFVACGCNANPPEAPLAPLPDYGIEPVGWQVSPDVRAEIESVRASDNYRPHRAATRIFVRSQLKYGLERDDYLHRWYDRPLMGDVRYAALNGRSLHQHRELEAHGRNGEALRTWVLGVHYDSRPRRHTAP